MTGDLVTFYAVAAGAVVTALAMVASRDVVRAALFMIGNFLLTAVLYLMLQAAFIAAVQVIVYAGAIMVLFLFVVMVLGGGRAALDEPLAGHRWAGLLFAALLCAVLVATAARGVPAAPAGEMAELPGGFGSPQLVGDSLFRDHLLAFEIVSVLLLVAMIGAVVIAHFRAGPSGGAEEEDEGIG
jgi:NADH-quinone oxidoreductase subunit J